MSPEEFLCWLRIYHQFPVLLHRWPRLDFPGLNLWWRESYHVPLSFREWIPIPGSIRLGGRRV